MSAHPLLPINSWRRDAVGIVEALFSATSSDAWDALLDLRQGLIAGEDWDTTLNAFLICREALEADHYLPFYRLRRLLTASLRLEAVGKSVAASLPLVDFLDRRPRSFSDLKRSLRRDLFEHAPDLSAFEKIAVRVTEYC
jgi:hypothetical protein